MTEYFDLTPSPRLLEVLGDIPLAPWQCIAELVDNSFDDFLATPLSERHEIESVVDVVIPTDPEDRHLVVRDSGRGMRTRDFENSLKAGYSGRGRFGTLGLFGMGFNIATARLGLRSTVATARTGAGSWSKVTIDFRELQRHDTFRVPVETAPKNEPGDSGTEIRVMLRPEIAEDLRRPAAISALREKLGDVYSYLLRDHVPGITGKDLSGNAGFTLRINGVEVEPRLPCIWAEHRQVSSRGAQVNAVAKIDIPLADAWACQVCGHWDRSPEPDRCLECESDALEKRGRRIYGWLGVQRYLDTSRYGIDFLRHGRKILLQSKALFTFQDPDTGVEDIEYPIEMPANRGRLVGEIHLDHAPVTYQKNDFDRSSQDWWRAVERIRGEQPMKPRKRGENPRPLAVLYSAFRRNDPGLRYLTPGDGEKALHDRAKQWADQFYAGVAAYQDDTEWYEAAERHQNIKDGELDPKEEAPSAIDDLLGGEKVGGPSEEQDEPTETDAERFERYRAKGLERKDLSGPITGPDDGAWELSVWTTREQLSDQHGNRLVALPRLPEGNRLEIYVDSQHPVFIECGRDLRDFAIIEAATTLARQASDDPFSATYVTAELLLRMPDQRFNQALLRERVESILRRASEAMLPAIEDDSETFWRTLSSDEKEGAEEAASAQNVADWEAAISQGHFIMFVPGSGLARLIREHPGAFLDGKVFKPAWRHWKAEDARHRSVEKVARSIEVLGEFLEDPVPQGPAELTVVRVLSEQVLDQLASDDPA